jgi:hypothetical protein
MNVGLFDRFSKKFSNLKVCSMQTKRQRDMTKLIVDFHSFAKTLKVHEATGLSAQGDKA